MKNVLKYLLIGMVVLGVSACQQRELNTRVSNTTGWSYFDPKTTNFEAQEGVGNANPVGMVQIQGGSFTVGEKDEFLTAPRNNETRTVTASHFFMDKYEITNLNWNEYLHWLEFVFGAVAPELVDQARPAPGILVLSDRRCDLGAGYGLLPMAYRPCQRDGIGEQRRDADS